MENEVINNNKPNSAGEYYVDPIRKAYVWDVLENKLLKAMLKETCDFCMLINGQTGAALRIENNLLESRCWDDSLWIENLDIYTKQYFEKTYIGDDVESAIRVSRLSCMQEELVEKEEYSFSFTVKLGGKICRKKWKVRYLIPEDNLLLLFRRDITDVYEQERRNRVFLENSFRVAQDANLAKSEFLLNVSEDVRYPLYGLSGLLEQTLQVAKDNPYNMEQVLLYLQKSMDCMKNLEHTLYNILDMSIIEKGQLFLSTMPVIFKRFMEEIVNEMAVYAKKKDIHIELVVHEPKLPVVMLDPIACKRAISGLVYNAIAFGKESGHVKITVNSEQLEEGKVLAQIVISDNGIGLSKEQLKRALETFTYTKLPQESEGQERLVVDSRTGLNFSTAHFVVEHMGGSMEIESEEKKGTTVTLRVPVEGSSSSEEYLAREVEHLMLETDRLDFQKFRALVCDDIAADREVTSLILQKIGLQVESVATTKEAVELLLGSKENTYQVLLMKAQMPGKTGLAATMEIRESDRLDLSDLTIIATTGHTLRDERIRTLESGMDYHLTLPLDEIVLKEILIRELFDLQPQKEYEARGFRIIK